MAGAVANCFTAVSYGDVGIVYRHAAELQLSAKMIYTRKRRGRKKRRSPVGVELCWQVGSSYWKRRD